MMRQCITEHLCMAFETGFSHTHAKETKVERAKGGLMTVSNRSLSNSSVKQDQWMIFGMKGLCPRHLLAKTLITGKWRQYVFGLVQF